MMAKQNHTSTLIQTHNAIKAIPWENFWFSAQFRWTTLRFFYFIFYLTVGIDMFTQIHRAAKYSGDLHVSHFHSLLTKYDMDFALQFPLKDVIHPTHLMATSFIISSVLGFRIMFGISGNWEKVVDCGCSLTLQFLLAGMWASSYFVSQISYNFRINHIFLDLFTLMIISTITCL